VNAMRSRTKPAWTAKQVPRFDIECVDVLSGKPAQRRPRQDRTLLEQLRLRAVVPSNSWKPTTQPWPPPRTRTERPRQSAGRRN